MISRVLLATSLLGLLASTLPPQAAAASEGVSIVVLARADVNPLAGMQGESRSEYPKKIRRELAAHAGNLFAARASIRQEDYDDLHAMLPQGREKYAELCGQLNADILYIGDLKVVNSFTNISGVNWPRMDLHLYNCTTGVSRREVREAIEPQHNDEFPYQRTIAEMSTRFLGSHQGLVPGGTAARKPKAAADTAKASGNTGKRALVVLVQADVDPLAGMQGESRSGYPKKIRQELATHAANLFGSRLSVRQEEFKKLRSKLPQGREKYAEICNQVHADVLYLGDLRVISSFTNISGSNWPRIDLHLHNCRTGISRREVREAIEPQHNDEFPYQRTIVEMSTQFLGKHQGIVEQ